MDILGYSKVCASWAPTQFTEVHKQSRLDACSELLEYCHSDKTFLQQIVTGDETWIHQFKPESKRASMESRHPTSPRSKKFKSQQSTGKVMVTVCSNSLGVILVDFMSKGATISSDVYIDTLKKLKARIQRVRPVGKCLRFYCNMTTLGLTPASKPVRSLAPLAGQQFHIPHIRQTWNALTSLCLDLSKKEDDVSPVMKRSKLLLESG